MATKLDKAHRKVKGMDTIRKNIKTYGRNMSQALQALAVSTGQRVLRDARAAVRTGSGRAPDPQTYELANGVRMVIGKNFVAVGTDVMHGFYQELGTVKNRPHPWLFPALRKNRDYYNKGMRQLHDKALRFKVLDLSLAGGVEISDQ